MNRSPERLAWSILFISLFTCCALAVGVPAVTLSYINTATVEAINNIKLQAGRVTTFSRTESEKDARVVSLEGRNVSEGTTISVDPESVGLLTISWNGDPDNPLVTLQLYSNAKVIIQRAQLPRFDTGATADDFQLQLLGGRVEVLDQHPAERKFNIRMDSEDTTTYINTPGSYSFEKTDGETRIYVRDGQAQITLAKRDESLILSGNQRAVASQAQGVAGPLPPFRNLVRNGNFQAPLDRDWKVEATIDAGSTVTGTATITDTSTDTSMDTSTGPGTEPNRYLWLERVGSGLGWGRTGVTQVMNEDVRDRRSLQLRVNFQIVEQELPVCGGEGSECPLMLRVDYRDKNGSDGYWLQGFYARGTPTNQLPDYIRSNNRGKHISRRLNVAEPWESENLLELLPDMQTIKSLTLYSEGHAVKTRINTVELLLQD